MSTLYNKIVIPLCFVSGLWIPAMLLCCVPWVQKQMLYLHWVTLWPGKWLTEPERAGFLKNQVSPFSIPTKDGETLFAWLIAPLGVYARNADAFLSDSPPSSDDDHDITSRTSFHLLQSDPQARLLIYFHGNTATLAQGRRTEEYRAYASGASDNIFVLTFDYRGFGASTGAPSEAGLLRDAEAVVRWALHTARVPPERIVLLGHSLGTAVATGVAYQYATSTSVSTHFAGLILCAAFTNAGNAFTAYSIGNVVPVLAPVNLVPALQRWFARRMRDTWRTDQRLVALAKQSEKFRLTLVHARDDGTMPWVQTEALFEGVLGVVAGERVPDLKVMDLGEAGVQEVWEGEGKRVGKLIAKHGDHNTMMKWTPISLAILESFGLTTIASSTPRS